MWNCFAGSVVTGIKDRLRPAITSPGVHHIAVCLFFIAFVVYNLNFRSIPSGDTLPAALLPFSLLEYHSLYFDNFSSFITNLDLNLPYMFSAEKGHYLSSYPIITPILVTPLYIIPYVILKIIGCPIDPLNPLLWESAQIMEKIAASIIASLSVVLMYLILVRITDTKTALITSLIFAFATNTWTISSQALWQHGMVELLLCSMIFVVILNEEQRADIHFAILGLLTALFMFNRPSDSLLLLPVIAYVIAASNWRGRLSYLSVAVICSIPVVWYNIYHFGNLFGGYGGLLSWFGFDPDRVVSFLGLLISPSRGLLVYTPVILLSLFGYYELRKLPDTRIRQFLYLAGVSVLLEILVYSSFDVWWAGWSYGPRFLTGSLPVLAIFMGIYLHTFLNGKTDRKKKLQVVIITVLLAWSILVQITGAFYYPNGNWDGSPASVDVSERLWDFKDTQIIRSYSAGIYRTHPIARIQDAVTSLRDGETSRGDIIMPPDTPDPPIRITLNNGFHGLEGWSGTPTRWTDGNATMVAYSSIDTVAIVNATTISFHRPRTLEIYANDRFIWQTTVPTSFVSVSIPAQLHKGENTIRLYVPEGAERPCDIPELNSKDTRWLSVAVQNITLVEAR